MVYRVNLCLGINQKSLPNMNDFFKTVITVIPNHISNLCGLNYVL